MSKRNEKISAFLDDEMHRDEAMSFSLSSEADDAKIIKRYQLAGDVLRSELKESSFVDVSAAVREALADENIADSMPSSTPRKETSSQTTNLATWGGLVANWFKPAAGMAMAALVAVVMVVSVNDDTSTATGPVAERALPLDSSMMKLAGDTAGKQADVNGLQTNEALSRTVSNVPGTNIAEQSVPVQNNNPNVDQYLMNQHLEFATQDALQGRMPYVRAVSFENEKQEK